MTEEQLRAGVVAVKQWAANASARDFLPADSHIEALVRLLHAPVPCIHHRTDPNLTCLDCGAGLLMEPGPIVPEPARIRRREPAEVAAYFDGAVAALHFVKGRTSSADGLRVVDVDSLIALFESAREAKP